MLARPYGLAFGLLVGCEIGGIGVCPVTGGPMPTPSATERAMPSSPPRALEPPSPESTSLERTCDGQLLHADRIVHFEPARRTLYTWTTVEQMDALRSATSKQLLADATERPAAVTAVFATLATIAGKDLLGDRFAKARTAWPLPWATRMQAPGHRLLRVDLRAEAYVVAFRRGELDAFDMENREVPLAELIDHPERIGAIYFVQDEVAREPGYRQIFVGNEAMIEEWSSGTEAIRTELTRERTLLAQLLAAQRERLPGVPSPRWNAAVVEGWSLEALLQHRTIRYQCPRLDGYDDTLAIPNADYEPTARNLARIIDTLEAEPPLAAADELVVRP